MANTPFIGEKATTTVQSQELHNFQPFNIHEIASRPSYEDLVKRQRDLDVRELELNAREKETAHLLSNVDTTNNFPPFPSCCPIKPCFFLDITLDIPAHYISIVTSTYHLWIGSVAVLILNFFACLGYFISSQGSSMAGSTLGSSILVLLLFPMASFICWFRPLYKAFKKDSSFNFFIFFFVMSSQIVVTIIQALGIYWLGSCGWLNGLMMLKVDTLVGCLMLLTATAFTVLAVSEIVVFIKVHRLYRNTDASFKKAKMEFGTKVASDLASSGQYSSLSR